MRDIGRIFCGRTLTGGTAPTAVALRTATSVSREGVIWTVPEARVIRLNRDFLSSHHGSDNAIREENAIFNVVKRAADSDEV